MAEDSFIERLRDITNFEELRDEHGNPVQMRIHYAIIALFDLPWFYELSDYIQQELMVDKLENLVQSIKKAIQEIKEL